MRAAQDDPMVNIVGVNDPFIGTKYMEYMFKHDTTHGTYSGSVNCIDESHIEIDGKTIKVFEEMDPSKIAWGDAGVDYVVDRVDCVDCVDRWNRFGTAFFPRPAPV